MNRVQRMEVIGWVAIALLALNGAAHVAQAHLHLRGLGDAGSLLLAALGVMAVPLLAFAAWEFHNLRAGYLVEVAELAERRMVEAAARADQDRTLARIESLLAEPDGFCMHYQPIIDMRSGRTIGHEALARFPDRPPDVWFADAAKVGLGVDLEVAAVAAALEAVGQLDGYVSINVTPATVLEGRFWTVIDGVDGDRLVIELTEHVLVEEYSRYEPALIELRRRGIRIAIDDAGAGHSSMRHIVHMAPEIIKLDRSLTSMVDIDAIKRSLVAALRGFAVAIDATLVAEGIERREEADTMTAMGVACGQGWLYSRALPLASARRAQILDLRSSEAAPTSAIPSPPPVFLPPTWS